MFLCGPKRQFKNMFDKKRKEVTIIYLSTLVLSIVVCFITFNKDIKLLILGTFNSSLLIFIIACKRRVHATCNKIFKQWMHDF